MRVLWRRQRLRGWLVGDSKTCQWLQRLQTKKKLRDAEAEAEALEAPPMGDEMLVDWPEEEEASDLLSPWEEDAAVEEEEPEETAVPPPLPSR